jgi:CDP-glycerol glycerophosphotransferase
MQLQYKPGSYPRIVEYHPLGDVYPLLPLCDLLITDYSSIFFDFLLLDRPMIFFAYDLDKYLAEDRAMYFEYDSITPGVKCHNYDELESNIDIIMRNGCKDGYSRMRKEVRSLTHDRPDDLAGRRILSGI